MKEFIHKTYLKWAKGELKGHNPDRLFGDHKPYMIAALILEVTQLRKELERLNSIIDKP